MMMITIIINLFRFHKFTMVLMPKRKKNVINYIYIIKPPGKKSIKEALELKLTSWNKKKRSDGKIELKS